MNGSHRVLLGGLVGLSHTINFPGLSKAYHAE
jgi:hypothetical protein